MKTDKFVARIAQGAAASIAASTMMPANFNGTPQLHPAVESVEAGSPVSFDATFSKASATGSTFEYAITAIPDSWTGKLEKEFRLLALKEATQQLSRIELRRLEQLQHWRGRLETTRTSEEILFQLQRDRLLEKMAENLQAYVRIQKMPSQTGAATEKKAETA